MNNFKKINYLKNENLIYIKKDNGNYLVFNSTNDVLLGIFNEDYRIKFSGYKIETFFKKLIKQIRRIV
jgi:hypothetical protein